MSEERICGLVAQFKNPAALNTAVKELRAKGYERFDAHSPFPVHGLSASMNLKQSVLPLIVFTFGLIGLACGLGLQTWVHVIEYPLVIGGKPFFDLPSFIPVAFELTILFSAFGTVFGMLGLNRLPTWNHEVFEHSKFNCASDNGFFISVESEDSKFKEKDTKTLLEQLGAHDVEIVKN